MCALPAAVILLAVDVSLGMVFAMRRCHWPCWEFHRNAGSGRAWDWSGWRSQSAMGSGRYWAYSKWRPWPP